MALLPVDQDFDNRAKNYSLSPVTSFLLRILFIPACLRFSSSRLVTDWRVGEVFILSGSSVSDSARIISSFSTALFLFPDCVRCDCDLIISSPDLFNFFPSFSIRSAFSPPEKTPESMILNLNSIFVLTLLTFCPPGPLLLDATKTNADSGMRSFKSSAVKVIVILLVQKYNLPILLIPPDVFPYY